MDRKVLVHFMFVVDLEFDSIPFKRVEDKNGTFGVAPFPPLSSLVLELHVNWLMKKCW